MCIFCIPFLTYEHLYGHLYEHIFRTPAPNTFTISLTNALEIAPRSGRTDLRDVIGVPKGGREGVRKGVRKGVRGGG